MYLCMYMYCKVKIIENAKYVLIKWGEGEKIPCMNDTW